MVGCCMETVQKNLVSLWSVPSSYLQIFWSKCCVHFWSELCQVTKLLTALHIFVPWWVLKDRLMLFRTFGTIPHILYIYIYIYLFPPPVPPHILCGLRGPPSWAWQERNRLLRLGRPWGAVTLSRWCVSGDRGGCSARRGQFLYSFPFSYSSARALIPAIRAVVNSVLLFSEQSSFEGTEIRTQCSTTNLEN